MFLVVPKQHLEAEPPPPCHTQPAAPGWCHPHQLLLCKELNDRRGDGVEPAVLQAGNPKVVNAWKSPVSSSSQQRIFMDRSNLPLLIPISPLAAALSIVVPAASASLDAKRSQKPNCWSPWSTSMPWAMHWARLACGVTPGCFTKGRHFTIFLSTSRPLLLYNTYSNCSQLEHDQRSDCSE